MGAPNLRSLFEEQYYSKLDGGILESFGRLFKNNLKLFVYPYLDEKSGELVTVDKLGVDPPVRQLYRYLIDRHYIVQLHDVQREYLKIHSPDVLQKIASGSREWEGMVPPAVAEAIKTRKLFGYAGDAQEPAPRYRAAAG